MNKLSLKPKILLGAFLLGSGGALGQEVAFRISESYQQTFNWTHFDENGNETDDNQNNLTLNQARAHYGCPETGGTRCAEGRSGSTVVTIYYE